MKKMVILAIFAVALFTLTACSNGQTANTQVDNGSGEKRGDDFRHPDFGQPKTEPDVRGLVSSIVGNEVTVLKIEKPQFNEEAKNKDEDDNSQDEKAMTMGTGSMPEMGGRGMSGDRKNMDEDAQAQMLERIKAMAVEEETVLIPVGIQMLRPDISVDAEKNTVLEASLEDIEKDIMLQVWLNKDITDRKVAEFVLIMK
jgi:hypothetical protein